MERAAEITCIAAGIPLLFVWTASGGRAVTPNTYRNGPIGESSGRKEPYSHSIVPGGLLVTS